MSIRDEINARAGENPPRLHRLKRSLESDPESRTMFLSEELHSLLEGPWASRELTLRAGRLRADLEEFIKGAELAACLEPFQAKTAYIGRLAPPEDGFWDIRSRDPSPAIRVVGGFAETDVFIALRWAPRSKGIAGVTKTPLGPRDSREWRDMIVQCGADWRTLFHTYPRVTGDNLNAHVSASIHAV
jgi:hypothetical protein